MPGASPGERAFHVRQPPEAYGHQPVPADYSAGYLRLVIQHRTKQQAPFVGKLVHDQFAVPPGTHKPTIAKRSQVVRDQGLLAFRDPREITDAQLSACLQGGCQHEARRIGKRLCLIGSPFGFPAREQRVAYGFRPRSIDTQ
jgi:hypothetical protein